MRDFQYCGRYHDMHGGDIISTAIDDEFPTLIMVLNIPYGTQDTPP